MNLEGSWKLPSPICLFKKQSWESPSSVCEGCAFSHSGQRTKGESRSHGTGWSSRFHVIKSESQSAWHWKESIGLVRSVLMMSWPWPWYMLHLYLYFSISSLTISGPLFQFSYWLSISIAKFRMNSLFMWHSDVWFLPRSVLHSHTPWNTCSCLKTLFFFFCLLDFAEAVLASQNNTPPQSLSKCYPPD